jgi:hypothetical protein
MESLTDSITKLDLKVLDMESNNEVAAEIGPLRYMAEITNKPMATIVNWFTLMIVCVFDPLAIAMVLAVNKFIGRKEEDEVVVKKEPVIKHAYVENDERMNIIGQNGNDGEHYSEVEEMIKKNEEILATKKVEPEDPKKKIYGGFSKPYSDGIQASEDNEDIKTY